jgi:6-phosphogluconolactonase (cycloisomerase 2 family)
MTIDKEGTMKKCREISMEEAVKLLTAEDNRKHVYAVTELERFDYINVLGEAVTFLTDDEEEHNG